MSFLWCAVSVKVKDSSRYSDPAVVTAFRRVACLALLVTSAVVCLQPCLDVIHVVFWAAPLLHPLLWGIVLLGLYYLFMILMIAASVLMKWLLLGKVRCQDD